MLNPTAFFGRMKNKHLLASIFLACLFVLVSCKTAYKSEYNTDTVLIDNIPFFSQDDYQCGPASLASVLNYWGVNVSPEDIAHEIYSKSAKGTLNIDMVLYSQRKGLTALQYSGNMDDLMKNIKAGLPVIVLVDYGFYIYQANHFMVVVGFNKNGVIVNSGKEREKFIPVEDFLKSWEKTKFWILLIKKSELRSQN